MSVPDPLAGATPSAGGADEPAPPGGALVPYDPMRNPLARFVPPRWNAPRPDGKGEATAGDPEDAFFVCGRCFAVHGSDGDRRQLCSCASPAEHAALAEEESRRDGSSWTELVELCRCCGMEALDASHKFAWWFCADCLLQAAEVNRACGSCVIPVGWHSVVNGVVAHPNRRNELPNLHAFADQLDAFLRESGDTWHWGRGVIERHWKAAGLPGNVDVPLEEYLDAVCSLGIDKAAHFEELRVARGVPDDWQSFATTLRR